MKNNTRKNLARSLRNGGYSYAEIQKFVSVPKATLSYWFRDIKLTGPQLERLREKRAEASRRGTEERSKKVARMIEEIETKSANDIGKVTKRELWLMGVVLYWRNHNKADVRKGVQFTSSDPNLIKLFLKWLKEIGQLQDSEIAFDIFMRGKNAAPVADYWAKYTGFPKEGFHVYKYKKGTSLRSDNGLLRIRVKASSMLARQLAGWAKGLQEALD